MKRIRERKAGLRAKEGRAIQFQDSKTSLFDLVRLGPILDLGQVFIILALKSGIVMIHLGHLGTSPLLFPTHCQFFFSVNEIFHLKLFILFFILGTISSSELF